MKYLIIGNGAAAIHAVDSIRSQDRSGDLTIICEESPCAYSKVLLHHYISRDIKEDVLYIRKKQFYKDSKANVIVNRAEKIEPDRQTVYLANGSTVRYDRLLVATGSYPWKPPIEGVDLPGVYTMWTLQDARKIRKAMEKAESALIIGGGFVGMQALDGLVSNGLEVTVIDIAERLLPASLDDTGSNILQKHLEEHGVRLFLGKRIKGIKSSDNGIMEIDLGYKTVSGGLVIVATGSKPNIGPVENTSVAEQSGILVDKFMTTNYGNVFAAGDVSRSFDCITGEPANFKLWTSAVEQGEIAGNNMVGKRRITFAGGLNMNSTEVLGLPVVSVGNIQSRSGQEELREETILNPERNQYQKYVFKNDNIVGALQIGDVQRTGVISSIIRQKRGITGNSLTYGSFYKNFVFEGKRITI